MSAHHKGENHEKKLQSCNKKSILTPYLELQKTVIAQELDITIENLSIILPQSADQQQFQLFIAETVSNPLVRVAFASSYGILTEMSLLCNNTAISFHREVLIKNKMNKSTLHFLKDLFEDKTIYKMSENMCLLILLLFNTYNIHSSSCKSAEQPSHIQKPLPPKTANTILTMSSTAQLLSNLTNITFNSKSCSQLLSVTKENLSILRAVAQETKLIDVQRETFIYDE